MKCKKMVEKFAEGGTSMDIHQFTKLIHHCPQLVARIFSVQQQQRELCCGTTFWENLSNERSRRASHELIKSHLFDSLVRKINDESPDTFKMPGEIERTDQIARRKSYSDHYDTSMEEEEEEEIDEIEKIRLTPSQHNKYAVDHSKTGVEIYKGESKRAAGRRHGKHHYKKTHPDRYVADVRHVRYTGPAHAHGSHHHIAVKIQKHQRAKIGRKNSLSKRIEKKGKDTGQGYIHAHEPRRQMSYWVNKQTGKTTFTKPKGIK
tara:strand:- start:232 stop:1017 length:786 start_codon:yes stop_codon:yes gene_type:complete